MIDAETMSSIDMVRASTRGIVKHGDLSRIRKLRYTREGFDREVWSTICELGWPGLRLPESSGGSGLGLLAYTALTEELGRGLVPEPLIPAMLASALLPATSLESQLKGETLVLPAWQDARNTLAPQQQLDFANGRLNATKVYVPMAAAASAFLVIGQGQHAIVDANSPGVSIEASGTQDGSSFATVRFRDALCKVFEADAGPPLAEAALATAAYLLGVMRAAIEMTVGYLKTRVQFGKTIGQFQVLQHMAVDMQLEAEVTSASIEAAALQWDLDGPTAAAQASISRAKARASSSAMKVTRDAIQLHGGIGFTDEHDIGLYLRKAMVAKESFGGTKLHRANFARLKPVGDQA